MADNQYSKVSSPENLYIFTITGEVLGNQTWSETDVTGEGGEGVGYLQNGTGFVNQRNITISSTVTERNRFFLKEETGVETEFIDAPISCRDGHIVSVIYIGQQTLKLGWPGYFYNHSTKQSGITKLIDTKAGVPYFSNYALWSFLLLIISFLSSGFGIEFGAFILFISLIIITSSFIYYIKEKIKSKRMKSIIEKKIKSELDEAKKHVSGSK